MTVWSGGYGMNPALALNPCCLPISPVGEMVASKASRVTGSRPRPGIPYQKNFSANWMIRAD